MPPAPPSPCPRCDGLTPDQADQLAIIGGSHLPYSEPYGELRQCASCGAWFRYTRDHDNEIGYVADAPSLDWLDREQARALAAAATAVAQRQLAHFATRDDDYGRRCAADYAAELARLAAVMTALALAAP